MSSDAERRAQRARQRAFRRLAIEHPLEFARLLDEEKDAEGIRPNRSRHVPKGVKYQAPWCAHCDLNRAVYRGDLCSTCYRYRHRHGELPPQRLLARRTRRLEEKRWVS